MRTSAIISSSLLAMVVSGAPVDLPKLPVDVPSLALLPTGAPALPGKISTEFSATIPSGLPTGVPAVPKEPANNAELPVENLPVKRAELPVVNGVVENVKVPNLVTLPTLPKAPIGNVNLPVRRADTTVVGDALKDVTLIDGDDSEVHLPPVSILPVNTGSTKKAADNVVNVPVSVAIDDVDEVPAINAPTVAAPTVPFVDVPAIPTTPEAGLASRAIKQSLPVVGGADVPLDVGKVQVGTVDNYAGELVNGLKVENLPKVARDIKQSLPIVGGADVPLDAGEIQVGTVDKYVDDLLKGTKIDSLPKVAREIEQSLPVVGGASVPLDAGKIQVGTVDKDVDEVVEGTTLKDVPVLDVVKGTTVKDLPNLGSRDIKQSLPVVGGVDVPLDAGKIQVGTVDTYVGDVVKGTTTGL